MKKKIALLCLPHPKKRYVCPSTKSFPESACQVELSERSAEGTFDSGSRADKDEV